MTHLGDITKIDWFHVPPVDVVTGGSPCQDLSVAGKRAGLAGERSGLYMEQIRCVKELRQADELQGRTGVAIRPRYMVWENVPGAFSSNGGEDFRAVLEEAAKIAQPDAVIPRPPNGKWTNSGAIVGDGWSIAWRVHDAQFWGVPQRRRRIALVCDFGGLSAPEILFERKGLSGDFEPGGTQREETAGGAGNGVEGASGCMTGWDCQSKRIFSPDGICATLNSGDREGGNQKPCVYDARGNGDGKTVCTLTEDHQNRVTDYTALCIGNGQANQSIDDKAGALNCMHDQQAVMVLNDQGGSVMDVSHDSTATLRAQSHGHEPAVMISAVDCRNLNEHQEGSGTLQSKENGGYSLDYQNPVRTPSVVRRLTPLECERLQGYPDGWTDIGEWVDSKGKRHKDADSPRYKALGNSIALPFWFWLLRRISAQYIGPATLGSLFDGISGFCYVWARCNGSKSCLWASEIEEFPIAVCKRHFGDEESGEVGDILEYL